MIKIQMNLEDSELYIFSTNKSKIDMFDFAREIASCEQVETFVSLSMREYEDGINFDIHFNVNAEDEYYSHKVITLYPEHMERVNKGDIVKLPIW